MAVTIEHDAAVAAPAAGPIDSAPADGATWTGALLVLVTFVWAALPPLHEMDLGQHLATGEWIWRTRAVPFSEPFAWTREGQPFYAYSWLAEVLFYLLLRTFGPLGLHLLEGALAGGAVLSMLWAGRQLGWSRNVCLAVAVLHLALFWGVAGTLRPQQLLFSTVPLAWGLVGGIRSRGVSALRIVGLVAVGALAANTHLFFPLTAVPLAYWLIAGPNQRGWLPAAGALLLGWLLSPYGLGWPRVFALYLGDNILLGRPPSIAEFVPGFEYASVREGVVFAVGALLLAPWAGALRGRPLRERVAHALCWTAGLLLFAYAGRLVVAWWLLALPLLGEAVARALAAGTGLVKASVARFATLGAAAAVLTAASPSVRPVFWRFEGGTEQRMLPRAGQDPALWLPGWLLCHTRPGANGRVFTEFNYGSELNWRLPGFSPSIDGRTIFPDSIAVDFSMKGAGRLYPRASTWRYADLALLDRSFYLSPVLDQDTGWVLLAEASPAARVGLGALWAKREWWQRWGSTTDVPARDVRVGDPRATCDATGTFPK